MNVWIEGSLVVAAIVGPYWVWLDYEWHKLAKRGRR